jgi:hypothetical protein
MRPGIAEVCSLLAGVGAVLTPAGSGQPAVASLVVPPPSTPRHRPIPLPRTSSSPSVVALPGIEPGSNTLTKYPSPTLRQLHFAAPPRTPPNNFKPSALLNPFYEKESIRAGMAVPTPSAPVIITSSAQPYVHSVDRYVHGAPLHNVREEEEEDISPVTSWYLVNEDSEDSENDEDIVAGRPKDDGSNAVYLQAKALYTCGCPYLHVGTVQAVDGVQILRPPRTRTRLASQRARSLRSWTVTASGGRSRSQAVRLEVCTPFISSTGLSALTSRTVAPSNYLKVLKSEDGGMTPILFQAKALFACGCPSLHADAVQAVDGMQILRPPRTRTRSASQRARSSESWTGRASGGRSRSQAVRLEVYTPFISSTSLCAQPPHSCPVKLPADSLSSSPDAYLRIIWTRASGPRLHLFFSHFLLSDIYHPYRTPSICADQPYYLVVRQIETFGKSTD